MTTARYALQLIVAATAAAAFAGSAPACSEAAVEPGAGGGGAAPEPWTLDSFCPRFAERFCEAMRPCCEESGFGYDVAGCSERYVRSACEPLAELARQGVLSFNLDLYSQVGADALVDECIATYEANFAPCQETSIYDAYDLFRAHNVVCNFFTGPVPVEGACQHQAECTKTFSKREWVLCWEGTGTCVAAQVPDVGGLCGWDWVCERGLYCDAEYKGNGTCTPVTPYGEACEPDPSNFECGLDGHCDIASKTCVRSAKGYGAPCAPAPFPSNDCRSKLCIAGRCTHPVLWPEGPENTETTLSPEICRGVPPP